jgi:hypothetical protein
MQFTAYTGSKAGFYFDARDTAGHTKRFTWGSQWTGDEHLFVRHQYNVSRESGGDVTVPYQATTGPIDGSWYAAADAYRRWLESTDLVPADREFPNWYLNRGATFHARSYDRPSQTGDQHVSFEETADRTVKLREKLDIPLQFSWWGYQRHGNFGGGDWFPPKEGWDAFDRVVDRLRTHDVTLLGFAMTNVLLKNSDLWENATERAKSWLVRDRDQEPRAYSLHGQTRYEPELTQQGWQEKLISVYESHVTHGAKQVQLDGFPWTGIPECYAEEHEHLPGYGGNWFALGAKSWLSSLRSKLKAIDEDIVMSGEGFADFYLSEMDIAMSRDIRAEAEDPNIHREGYEIIPLSQYTLGQFMAFRGDNHFPLVTADWTEPEQYLRLTLGRSLMWGMLPLFRVAVQTSERLESDSLLEFLERVGSVFSLHGTRFLVQGELQPTPDLDVSQVQTHCSGPADARVDVTADAVLHSVWDSSELEETERAATFANISEASQTVALSSAHLGSSDDLVYLVVNGQYRRFEDSVTTGTEVTIPPRSVVMVVSTPPSEAKEEAIAAIEQAQQSSRDGVEEGIRAFVEGNPSEAVRVLDEATSTATESRPETEASGSESESGETTVAGSQPATETAAPGFSVVATLGGVGAAIAGLINRNRTDDD